jgi:hypothetical protein
VAVDSARNVYIADQYNQRIRKVAATNAPPPPPPSQATLVPRTPTRLLDTRPASAIGYSGAKPTAKQVVPVTVPSGNKAVALNVTGVDATAPGFVTVYPCGSTRPIASNLNLVPGVVSPNAVVVAVGTNDQVCVYTDAGTHLIVDLTGVLPSTSPLVPVIPTRLLDTRPDSAIGYAGPKPAGGATVAVETGAAPGATVVVNVTGVDATADGYVTAYPCGETRPGTSNLNLRRNVISPNLVVVKAGTGGKVCLYTDGGAHLIADLAATIPPSATTITPLTPSRLLDTRPESRIGYTGDKPAPGAIVTVTVPSGATTAIVNITGVDASADGYVTAYPCGTIPPNASNLNLVPGVISPNLAIVGVGTNNQICLFTQAGTHLIADLTAIAA